MIEEAKLYHNLIKRIIDVFNLKITLLDEIVHAEVSDRISYLHTDCLYITYSDMFNRYRLCYDLISESDDNRISSLIIDKIFDNMLWCDEDYPYPYVYSDSKTFSNIKSLLEMPDDELELLLRLN